MIYQKKAAIWLFCCALMVVCMIVVGGFTRLSQAGLSIVEWKPITGTLPPITDEAWQKEFDMYKGFPEYKERNFNFTLEEFKGIYMIEYYHRLLGRVTGLVFLLPFLYFMCVGVFSKGDKRYLSLVLLLGCCQGFMGWYMVKSGLIKNPDVSHYRLASHLMLAFLIYAMLIWKGMCFLYGKSKRHSSPHIFHSISLLIICVVQIFFGALVAGLDAGLVYNSFPLMGENFIPHELLYSFSRENILNDPVVVQFLHRMFAILLLIYSVYFMIISKKNRKSVYIAVFVISLQFLLGVLTLLYKVPISLGVIHQFGAIIVFTNLLFILYSLRYVTN